MMVKKYKQYFVNWIDGMKINKDHFIGMENASNIETYINTNTKLIWVESPTNPMLNIIDIKATAAIAKKHNVRLARQRRFVVNVAVVVQLGVGSVTVIRMHGLGQIIKDPLVAQAIALL